MSEPTKVTVEGGGKDNEGTKGAETRNTMRHKDKVEQTHCVRNVCAATRVTVLVLRTVRV